MQVLPTILNEELQKRIVLKEKQEDGTHFVITSCAKNGFVFNNHRVEFMYDAENVVELLTRAAKGEGDVVHGTMTIKEGKLRMPYSPDALVSFGLSEPIFPIGYYLTDLRSRGAHLRSQDEEL